MTFVWALSGILVTQDNPQTSLWTFQLKYFILKGKDWKKNCPQTSLGNTVSVEFFKYTFSFLQ